MPPGCIVTAGRGPMRLLVLGVVLLLTCGAGSPAAAVQYNGVDASQSAAAPRAAAPLLTDAVQQFVGALFRLAAPFTTPSAAPARVDAEPQQQAAAPVAPQPVAASEAIAPAKADTPQPQAAQASPVAPAAASEPKSLAVVGAGPETAPLASPALVQQPVAPSPPVAPKRTDSAQQVAARPVMLPQDEKLQEAALAKALAKHSDYGAYDRRPPYGWAKGRKAGGQPEPVRGLVNPDKPALSKKSSSMEDLVLPWGYPLETYPVETEDGFVLRLYRIPYGVKNSTKPDPRKPVVLLIHGITLASSCFVVLDPESSMGFYLADAGFDVWMLNTRSNTYSRGNRYRGDTSVAYWQYSIDELALLDLPAQIDFILKFTGKPSLATVGHSQGCTLPLMLLSAKPEYNAKVWLMMQIGAVTHAEEIQAKYMRHQAELRSAQKVLGGAAIGNFIMNSVTSQLISSCNGTYSRLRYCQKLIHFLFYGDTLLVSPWDLMRIGSTWPSTVGTRNLDHWSQMSLSASGLRMYDFGTNCSSTLNIQKQAFQETCNQAIYGQEDPPKYDLSMVTARAAILEGANDVMATPADVDKVVKEWGAQLVYNKLYPMYSHMDFVWARDPLPKQDIIQLLWRFAPPPGAP